LTDPKDLPAADAIAKARRLVAELEKQSAEMDVPSAPAEGKRGVADALAAARRVLEALEDE
jgi:hypothetical protein